MNMGMGSWVMKDELSADRGGRRLGVPQRSEFMRMRRSNGEGSLPLSSSHPISNPFRLPPEFGASSFTPYLD